MRIAVVGASGNVGTAVLRRLAAEPDIDDVVGIARRPPAPDAGDPYDRARWLAVDVGAAGARERLREAFAGAQGVISLAWRLQSGHDRAAMERVNVGGARAVVDAALDAG